MIAEGRMIIKRIHLRLRANAVGETVIRKPDPQPETPPSSEQKEKPQ